MKNPKIPLLASLLALALSGCAGNPDRTHRGDVLDDKVVAQRIQSELTRGGNDFRDVHVTATNGVVILGGAVRSEEIRAHVQDLARRVSGETKLEDKLEVQP